MWLQIVLLQKLYNLIQKLDKYEYKPLKMVVNFNNKVIGVIAEEPGISDRKGFVPCYPSAIDENLKHNLAKSNYFRFLGR